MPAIQPEKLERQIDELLELIDDPPVFIRSCLNLLDYYADRTKRPRSSSMGVEIARILRVPRPVMKTLCVRIKKFDQGSPENWLAISKGLWEKGIRETRQVAACTLDKLPEGEIPDLVVGWAVICEDDQALTEVAVSGLNAWRGRDHQRFYRTIVRWLEDGHIRIRQLAVLALIGRSEDEDFHEIPEMLKVLSGISTQLRGSSQRSLTALIRKLAEISPPEVAKFLIEQVESDVGGARRLAQHSVSAFPERLQAEIRQAMG
jgi:hypothetical protein